MARRRGRLPEVHVGRDGWLFWLGRSGQIPALYRDDLLARWHLWRWTRLVHTRARRARALGADYRQVIIPDKLSLCAAKTSEPLVDPGLSLTRRIRPALASRPGGTAFVDLVADFEAAGEDVLHFFLKTDTHFSYRGYLRAYKALCGSLGVAPAETVLSGTAYPGSLAMDTGGKLDPPVLEAYEHYDYPRRAVRVETNELNRLRESHPTTRGLHAGSRMVFRNAGSGADPRRLLLFGDSYSFVITGLAGMLAESFCEVHAVWSARIDWAYVARLRPDVLVNEIAERFTRRLPRDGVDIEALAVQRLSEARRRGLVLQAEHADSTSLQTADDPPHQQP